MILNNKRLIGFSTGILYHTYPSASKEMIQICKNMGCDIIELNCPVERFDLMDKLKQSDLRDFKFVSFHLPCGVSSKNFEFLKKVQSFHNKLKFDEVVVHPDVIEDWNVLKLFNLPFSIENMDEKKKIGRTLESMKKIMSQNDYNVTLDINHCYVNDPTLKLAEDLWDEFKGRISHFHLSGYEKSHDPLIVTKQTSFIDFMKNKDRPIIIESVCKDLNQAKKEFNYIVNYLE
ncbi:hypothetical protein KAW43_01990 [Candidatus Parcubacteria bacterium]|nr:hypothetical protein [Candidatus Parcubacteria bacterium]